MRDPFLSFEKQKQEDNTVTEVKVYFGRKVYIQDLYIPTAKVIIKILKVVVPITVIYCIVEAITGNFHLFDGIINLINFAK